MNKIEMEKAYNAQKPLPIKELLKLQIGDVVVVKWPDCPNQTMVIVERMPRDKAERWSVPVLTRSGLYGRPVWDKIVGFTGTNIFDLDVLKIQESLADHQNVCS